MSLSACPDEEGIPWLCKYLKNAQVTLRQDEVWGGNRDPQASPGWVLWKG